MKTLSVLVVLLAVLSVVGGKKKEEALNRNTTPFWLRDGNDGMCLGPEGFGPCDPNSIWILASTNPQKKTHAFVSMLAPEPDRMCLGSSGGMFSSRQRVGVFKCGSASARGLNLADLSTQGQQGYLLAQGSKNCLARAQGRLRNSADMQLCTKGTPMTIVETPIHTAGMQIMTEDNHCFDGMRFRVCNDGDPTLRWGIGLDFRATEPSRNLYSFFDQEKCVVREGESARKGDCKSKGAGKWGWREGKLIQGGSHCLGRTRDNTAVLVPCSEGHEHVSFVTPEIAPVAAPTKSTKFGDRERGQARKGSPLRFEL